MRSESYPGLGRDGRMSDPAAALPCSRCDTATASAPPPAHSPGIHGKQKAEKDHLHLTTSKRKIPEQVTVL